MSMDQPAAIIKNENGMYTIRNPALHQAVTSGLAMGGYQNFGNVNYYTPQEAVAEATRASAAAAAAAAVASASSSGGSKQQQQPAAQQQQQIQSITPQLPSGITCTPIGGEKKTMDATNNLKGGNHPSSSTSITTPLSTAGFSYFSNNVTISPITPQRHTKQPSGVGGGELIVGGHKSNNSGSNSAVVSATVGAASSNTTRSNTNVMGNYAVDHHLHHLERDSVAGAAALPKTPIGGGTNSTTTRSISAIGSEVKNVQQYKNLSIEELKQLSAKKAWESAALVSPPPPLNLAESG